MQPDTPFYLSLEFSAACLGLLGNIIVAIEIIRSKMPMNIASWAIWATLDWLALAAAIAAGDRFPWLIFTFGVSASAIVFLIWKQGYWKWGQTEKACTALALISLVLWFFGPIWTLVGTLMAMVIGGFPQLLDAFEKARVMRLSPWLLFASAGSVSFYGANTADPAEFLYPAFTIGYNALVIMAIVRGRLFFRNPA